MKNLLKKKWKVFLFIIVLLLILCIILLFLNISGRRSEVFNNYFEISYDSTWNLNKKTEKELEIEHKKSKSILSIKYKIVEDDLFDVSLSNLINDLSYSIQKQNSKYKLISKDVKSFKYDAYELLYEDDKEQALVTIVKKDNVIVFITYNASSEYFDIVLDSVDSIINTLEIFSGEKIE